MNITAELEKFLISFRNFSNSMEEMQLCARFILSEDDGGVDITSELARPFKAAFRSEVAGMTVSEMVPLPLQEKESAFSCVLLCKIQQYTRY